MQKENKFLTPNKFHKIPYVELLAGNLIIKLLNYGLSYVATQPLCTQKYSCQPKYSNLQGVLSNCQIENGEILKC